ncbi:hypothetical protein MKX03_027609 [Papaver bracteatum]|nr:hypothetical protein MKX03_027609 [Papaver bracteatum]
MDKTNEVMENGVNFGDGFVEDAKNKNIEIMGNTLYKAYLKDFSKFCHSWEITIGMMVLTSTGFSRGFSYVTFAEIEDAKEEMREHSKKVIRVFVARISQTKGLEAGISWPTSHWIPNTGHATLQRVLLKNL